MNAGVGLHSRVTQPERMGGEMPAGCERNIRKRWSGKRAVADWVAMSGFAPFSCSGSFPFYVARIDDRLLLRPTPDGVRLTRIF